MISDDVPSDGNVRKPPEWTPGAFAFLGYDQLMKVFIPGSHNRKTFHRHSQCRALKAAAGILEVDIKDAKAKPCKICFPELPSLPKVRHDYCHLCDSRRACRHNGGILITEVHTHQKKTSVSQPGDQFTRTRWVWPDSKMALAKLVADVV